MAAWLRRSAPEGVHQGLLFSEARKPYAEAASIVFDFTEVPGRHPWRYGNRKKPSEVSWCARPNITDSMILSSFKPCAPTYFRFPRYLSHEFNEIDAGILDVGHPLHKSDEYEE